MSYYNTTNEDGQTLIDFQAKAFTQDQAVLEIMKRLKKAGASRVFEEYQKSTRLNTPPSSIKRSLTNLKNKGILEKTSEKVIGNYGRNEYVYSVLA